MTAQNEFYEFTYRGKLFDSFVVLDQSFGLFFRNATEEHPMEVDLFHFRMLPGGEYLINTYWIQNFIDFNLDFGKAVQRDIKEYLIHYFKTNPEKFKRVVDK